MLSNFSSYRFPAGIAGLLVQMGKESGYTAEDILKGTGVSQRLLHDPDNLLTTVQYQNLILKVLKLTDNPSLGIHLGQRVNILHLGMIGIVMMSYPTLKEAIASYFNNWGALLPYFKPVEINEQKVTTYAFEVKTKNKTLERFLHEFLISCTFSLACFITGRKLNLIEVNFTFSNPLDVSPYRDCFGNKVHFGANRNCFRFETSVLRTRLWGADIHTNKVADRILRKKLAKLRKTTSLADQIYHLLFQSSEPIPDLPTIAKTLNLGVRTLGRRLEQEDTSYQRILNRVRLELSLRLLENPHLQINEIAYRLGYCNPSSFGRAFKQWTGKSPGLFRDEMKCPPLGIRN